MLTCMPALVLCFLPFLFHSGNPLVPDSLKRVLRCMEIVSGVVPCTDASRRRMRHQLRALQVWQGLPSIFFTLNPADTRHPFTLYYSSCPEQPWQPCSTEHDLTEALAQVNLLQRVAADPVAVARAFHERVQLFLQELLGCITPGGAAWGDGVASGMGSGLLGPVAAYYGVTEPQLRGSLHLHMLIHLYAFSTPAAFLARLQSVWGTLADRLLQWTSSLLATSLESIPRAWNLPCDSQALFTALQPLPYSTRQRALLSAHEAAMWDFDLASQTWFLASTTEHFCPQPPWFEPPADSSGPALLFAPWPRQYLMQAGDAADWSRHLLFDLRHSALHCCLHECRPRTCHKGAIGRLGFCRMGFWHWCNVNPALQPPVWQRRHGLPLQDRPTVGSVPPLAGVLLTERHHPFHTRFNAGVLAAVKCNHDLSVLVRAPEAAAALDAEHFATQLASSTQLATFYITGYMSKVQPHLTNLWHLLEQGQRRLEHELQQQASAGAVLVGPSLMGKTLNRMLSSCQRRAHKSLPEMCHYLLGYPEAYSSHAFRPLFVGNLLCRAASLLPLAHTDLPEPESVAWVPRGPGANDNTEGASSTAAQPSRLNLMTQELDYMHRGPALQLWPLYFYVAAVSRSTGQRCSAGAYLEPFAPDHPNAAYAVQKIALTDPWLVPQVVGRAVPSAEKDPELRAVLLLLLFKPWSHSTLQDLLLPCTVNQEILPTWLAAFDDFMAHTAALRSSPATRPAPFTPEYWAHRALVALLCLHSTFP